MRKITTLQEAFAVFCELVEYIAKYVVNQPKEEENMFPEQQNETKVIRKSLYQLAEDKYNEMRHEKKRRICWGEFQKETHLSQELFFKTRGSNPCLERWKDFVDRLEKKFK